MRIEPFGVDSYVHVVKRGARGTPIVRDSADRVRFARLLYYLNDTYRSEFWENDVKKKGLFERPGSWPAREPLVRILAWTLMPNHFHLLLQETHDGGVSRFMQRLGGSMARHFNEKHGEQGSLFQGAYRSRTVGTDRHMRWALSYVMVKNVFELYPGGFDVATRHFEKAWRWGTQYPYSSFRDFASGRHSPILDARSSNDFFTSPHQFKAASRDMVLSRLGQPISIEEVALE